MLGPSHRGTGDGTKAVGLQEAYHVGKRLEPIEIMFEAFARDDGIECFGGQVEILAGADEIDAGSRADVDAEVVAAVKESANAPVLVPAPDLEDPAGSERLGKAVSDERKEEKLLRMSHGRLVNVAGRRKVR
jgi:hypothetical protein